MVLATAGRSEPCASFRTGPASANAASMSVTYRTSSTTFCSVAPYWRSTPAALAFHVACSLRRNTARLLSGEARGPPRDVDQAANPRVVPSLGDHGAAVGVADQDRRAVQERDDTLRRRHVVRERRRGVLHDAYGVAVLDERVVHALPPCGRSSEHLGDNEFGEHLRCQLG